MSGVAQGRRILLLDSGVGGLSVLAEIRGRLPGIGIVYVADSAFYPYGDKPEAALVERLPRLLAGLCARFDPDAVVVACNTASTVALPASRAALRAPVVGCVPAIKPAAEISRSRCIGLLGTPGTVRRAYSDRLVADFAADCRVLRHGSAALVELAEAKLAGTAPPGSAVADALAPLFAAEAAAAMDVVVLACTHFPLLRDELAAAAPRSLGWVDSGAAIARRVEAVLAAPAATAPAPEGEDLALVTGSDAASARAAAALRGFGFARVEVFEAALSSPL